MDIDGCYDFTGDQPSDNMPSKPPDYGSDHSAVNRGTACTVTGLCAEVRELVHGIQELRSSSELQPSHGVTTTEQAVQDLLTQLHQFATPDVQQMVPISTELDRDFQIRPPRQLLSLACKSFFQSKDFATDVFCQPKFWINVKRIYGSAFEDSDMAWAVCFNVIILLGLGAEQPDVSSDPGLGTQFLRPFMSAILRALGSGQLFMTCTLINVQSLALLSVFAQQYFQPQLSELLLDHGCVLAKVAHSQDSIAPFHPRDHLDAEDWLKVLTNLFVRDKSLSILRGRNCCLPSYDWRPPSVAQSNNSTQTNYFPRVELAHIQEQVYLFLYSKKSLNQHPSQRRSNIDCLNGKLHQFAKSNSALFSESLFEATDLHLAFRMTRIVVLRQSSELKHSKRVLEDSRICCRILINSLGQNELRSTPLPLYRMLHSFPIVAFFALTLGLFRPSSDNINANSDLELLQKVQVVFQDFAQRMPTDTAIQKSANIMQTLVTLAHTLRNQSQSPPRSDTATSSNDSEAQNRSFPLNMVPQHLLNDLMEVQPQAVNPHISMLPFPAEGVEPTIPIHHARAGERPDCVNLTSVVNKRQ